MAVCEQLRSRFDGNRRNLIASHSNYANIKKAHTLGSCQGKSGYLILDLYHRLWPDTLGMYPDDLGQHGHASQRNLPLH